jgi:sialic acid synthase SpsE
VQSVRAAEKQMGSPAIRLMESEQFGRTGFRLSCVAKDDLAAGTVMTKDHIAYRRPGSGMRPALVDLILGRKLKKDVPKGHVFMTQGDFE